MAQAVILAIPWACLEKLMCQQCISINGKIFFRWICIQKPSVAALWYQASKLSFSKLWLLIWEIKMFDVFGSVKGLLKLDQVTVDNNIFRLHYKATVVILIAFSLLVTARQYIGDPIDCIVEGVPSNVMDTYCWIHSTFTLPDRLNGEVGVDVPHPGKIKNQ